MRCVILQPSYIPWRGYFDQIAQADVFVFYDNVQYDKHGWRNRNRIKTHQGAQWLTIPVHPRDSANQPLPIHRVEIDWRQPWSHKHWATIYQTYRKAPFFRRYQAILEDFYQRHDQYLADFTIELTIALSAELGINQTRFIRASTLEVTGNKTDRLINILTMLGATEYISGPSAKVYLEEEKFLSHGIDLRYMVYNYPEYTQLYPPYDPQVSVLDLMFMMGPEALRYITG